MKTSRFIVLFFTIFLLGCKSEEIKLNNPAEIQNDGETSLQNDSKVMKGVIRVKLDREIGDEFVVNENAGQLRSSSIGIDEYLQQIGAKSMKRVFPFAGKFEERTRHKGLHLWYDIFFDESKSVTRAATDVQNILGVEIVEKIPLYTLPPYTMSVANIANTRASAISPFNDPYLSRQWHYNNLGTMEKFVKDADCNLFEAWEKETGNATVIVGVQDQGVEVTHEDLKDNMWINEAEMNGQPGVDDDKNGFIDDVYGFNFIRNKGEIIPGVHGTHVAGTVAARNNNGIGVCGVAGGDGSPGSGARIMTCQMFDGGESGGAATAMKYQADNGAVISQNSWGSGLYSPSLKAAIDYFIEYAGCDNDGNQLPSSPMKGGVVFFAAGNENEDVVTYPEAYEPIIAVSAMAPDYKKAYYTDRGNWVNIMAPGGGGEEFILEGGVYSSILGNKYGWMSGTSMACPHVSGIAALVVSHFGKQGFTNKMLEERLLSAFRPRNIDKENPGFEGRLGRGYIDAARAFDTNQNKAPDKVNAVSIVADYTWFEFTWKAVGDEDDKTASHYQLYYSDKSELTATNYKNASMTTLNGVEYNPGESIVYKNRGLKPNTTYYFAMVAEDRWRLQSNPIFFSGKTKENFPPKLTRTGVEKIRITRKEIAQVKILVEDPEGQEWTFNTFGQVIGVESEKDKEGIVINIRAMAPIGKHAVTVRVTDNINASAEIEIPFEIYENYPPKQLKEFQQLFIPIGKKDYSLDLSEYFVDGEGQTITYTARSSDPSAIGVRIEGNKIIFDSAQKRLANIEVVATDSQGAEIQANISVRGVNNDLVYFVYPTPATTELNLLLSDEVQQAALAIYTSIGNLALKKEISISSTEQRIIHLDISKLSSGTYVLHIDANGKVFKQVFIKL